MEQDLRLIQDDKDVLPMCKLNEGGPRDTIILYVESGHAPLAIEVLDGVGQGVGAGGGVGAATRGAGVSVEGGVGATTEAPTGIAIGGDASVEVEEELDWLNEGLEGEDFDDDIFGSPPHKVPPKPNTVPSKPNIVSPQPTIDTPQSNTNTP